MNARFELVDGIAEKFNCVVCYGSHCENWSWLISLAKANKDQSGGLYELGVLAERAKGSNTIYYESFYGGRKLDA